MDRKMKMILCCLCVILIGGGCHQKRITRTDTTTSGIATIVSDDCFGNITQEEIDVFEALNSDASILPLYTDEARAVKLLIEDSIRFAILARDLTEHEKEIIHAGNRELVPRSQKIAIDGIALIVNRNNPLSRMSVVSLRKVMMGDAKNWNDLDPSLPHRRIAVVFDSPNSSMARFVRDSVCGGIPLSGDIRALEDNRAVLDYVSTHPDALGVLGVNWISNPNDSTQVTFNRTIKVLSVSRTHPASADNSYLPVPAYLYLRYYPLTRDVYAVLTDLKGTLPAGFTHFIAGDRGQRIILKSGLVPATRPVRTVEIKETF